MKKLRVEYCQLSQDEEGDLSVFLMGAAEVRIELPTRKTTLAEQNHINHSRKTLLANVQPVQKSGCGQPTRPTLVAFWGLWQQGMLSCPQMDVQHSTEGS